LLVLRLFLVIEARYADADQTEQPARLHLRSDQIAGGIGNLLGGLHRPGHCPLAGEGGEVCESQLDPDSLPL
jgi:hypothetical protein